MEKLTSFAGYKPAHVDPRCANMLTKGQYLITIEKVVDTDDQHHIDGEPLGYEDDQRDWVDPNPVLYVYGTCAEGVFHHRFYGNGYKKFEDLLRDDKYKSHIMDYRRPKSPMVKQFAIDKATNERVFDERNSFIARDKLNQFATAAGTDQDHLEAMVGKKVWVELVPEHKLGKTYTKLLQVSSEDKPFVTEANLSGWDAGIQPKSVGSLGIDMSKFAKI